MNGQGNYSTALEACRSTHGSFVAFADEYSPVAALCKASSGGMVGSVFANPPCPNQCVSKAGTSDMFNITSGWKRTPAINQANEEWVVTNKFPPGGTGKVCSSGGCEQTFDANGPCPGCSSWVSQVPGTNGLYRVSTDLIGTYTGSTCSPSDAGMLPASMTQADDSKDPPCPGYVGEVNGVRGCYGTAENPVNVVPGNTSSSPTDVGNPSAGKVPEGSSGSGRTPSTGTGGSQGGPAAALGTGGGVKPDGTTDAPGEGKEQAACGAPGQPKCSVKVDETGTPDGKTAYGKAKADLDKLESDYTDNLNTIKSTADKDTSWGIVPSWISHGECTPWDLGSFQIMGQAIPLNVNICAIMPYVVATTSFLWVVGTFFLTIGMVFRVTAAPGG